MKITLKQLRQIVKEELENNSPIISSAKNKEETKEQSKLEIAANEAKRKAEEAKKAAMVADRAVKRAEAANKADSVLSSVLDKLKKLSSNLAKAGIKSTLGDVEMAVNNAKKSLSGEAQESKENPHTNTLKSVVKKSENIKVAPIKNGSDTEDNLLKGIKSINK